jgi:hypothetical protein
VEKSVIQDSSLLKRAEDIGPVPLLLVAFASSVNKQQQHAIEYLREENRILRAQFGNRRTGDQRRSLAAKARRHGRRMLRTVTIVTPGTLLSWDRKLIAGKILR